MPDDGRLRKGRIALLPRLVCNPRLGMELIGMVCFERRERPREALRTRGATESLH